MFFAYGLGNSLSFPLAAGATTILHTERVTPDYVSSVFQQRRPTAFFGVPALYGALVKRYADGAGLDIGSLRLCVSAGEALPGKIFEDWKRETGLSILDGIGSTEMLHIFISNNGTDSRPDCSGTVVNGYEARLLDDNGSEAGAGHVGSLWVRGDSATAGYWNMPDLTADIIRQGWVKTGDLYRSDADGLFYQLGRSDDCFKVKGLWVSPLEVESVLLSHESVTEAAVVPDFDSSGLATAHAFVVIGEEKDREGAAEVLLNYAAARLPGHKVPSRIDLVEALPRTATGKVQRFKLKQQSGRGR
jgi:acyl-coenzyme A synthetase/AMP-(fatty) acid ligase